jgi:hypothetical protein
MEEEEAGPATRGRPRMGASAEDIISIRNTLDNLRGMNMTWRRIAQEIQVSRPWLTNWRSRHSYVDPSPHTDISNGDLDLIITALVRHHPSRGEIFVWSELQNNYNITITRDRLRQVSFLCIKKILFAYIKYFICVVVDKSSGP